VCESCLRKCTKSIETPYLYITSIYSFKDPFIKQAIHEIKYYHHSDLIEPFAKEMSICLKKVLDESRSMEQESSKLNPTISHELSAIDWVIVPVPMPRLRKYIRGYNQAELIAQAISKKLSLLIRTDLLIRSRTPKRQVRTKSRTDRLNNQKNSFKVIRCVKNLNIILVDDVTTTGATISEAREILLKSGANNVKAVTIAH
jgi:ComF family protein